MDCRSDGQRLKGYLDGQYEGYKATGMHARLGGRLPAAYSLRGHWVGGVLAQGAMGALPILSGNRFVVRS